jgi:hypothetical protein
VLFAFLSMLPEVGGRSRLAFLQLGELALLQLVDSGWTALLGDAVAGGKMLCSELAPLREEVGP